MLSLPLPSLSTLSPSTWSRVSTCAPHRFTRSHSSRLQAKGPRHTAHQKHRTSAGSRRQCSRRQGSRRQGSRRLWALATSNRSCRAAPSGAALSSTLPPACPCLPCLPRLLLPPGGCGRFNAPLCHWDATMGVRLVGRIMTAWRQAWPTKFCSPLTRVALPHAVLNTFASSASTLWAGPVGFAHLASHCHDGAVPRMSNRFVGPVLRLRKGLREVAEGRPAQPLNFRDDDFWREMASDFNCAAAHVARAASERMPPPKR